MQHKITIERLQQVQILYETNDNEFRSATPDIVQAIKDGVDFFDGTYDMPVNQTMVNDWTDGANWEQASQLGSGNVTDIKTLPNITTSELQAIIAELQAIIAQKKIGGEVDLPIEGGEVI